MSSKSIINFHTFSVVSNSLVYFIKDYLGAKNKQSSVSSGLVCLWILDQIWLRTDFGKNKVLSLSALARSLDIKVSTVSGYVDILTELGILNKEKYGNRYKFQVNTKVLQQLEDKAYEKYFGKDASTNIDEDEEPSTTMTLGEVFEEIKTEKKTSTNKIKRDVKQEETTSTDSIKVEEEQIFVEPTKEEITEVESSTNTIDEEPDTEVPTNIDVTDSVANEEVTTEPETVLDSEEEIKEQLKMEETNKVETRAEKIERIIRKVAPFFDNLSEQTKTEAKYKLEATDRNTTYPLGFKISWNETTTLCPHCHKFYPKTANGCPYCNEANPKKNQVVNG